MSREKSCAVILSYASVKLLLALPARPPPPPPPALFSANTAAKYRQGTPPQTRHFEIQTRDVHIRHHLGNL